MRISPHRLIVVLLLCVQCSTAWSQGIPWAGFKRADIMTALYEGDFARLRQIDQWEVAQYLAHFSKSLKTQYSDFSCWSLLNPAIVTPGSFNAIYDSIGLQSPLQMESMDDMAAQGFEILEMMAQILTTSSPGQVMGAMLDYDVIIQQATVDATYFGELSRNDPYMFGCNEGMYGNTAAITIGRNIEAYLAGTQPVTPSRTSHAATSTTPPPEPITVDDLDSWPTLPLADERRERISPYNVPGSLFTIPDATLRADIRSTIESWASQSVEILACMYGPADDGSGYVAMDFWYDAPAADHAELMRISQLHPAAGLGNAAADRCPADQKEAYVLWVNGLPADSLF